MKHKFISKRYWNDLPNLIGEHEDFKKYNDIINLSIGDPDLTTDKRIINKAFEDAKNGHTHYTDSYGSTELREELCKYYKDTYNYNVDPKECMITTSGSHAMWLTLQCILNDGEEVIVIEPCFTPYIQQINLARGKSVILKTYEEDEFQINPRRLERIITNKTKAVIINTPNNPTGACFTKETLEYIRGISVKNDLIVISDDIYTLFSYAEPFTPIVTLEGMRERTIVVGSFSKDYCMTGWRIGYVLAPPFIIKTMKDINENNVYSAPSISQRAALHALRMRDEIQPVIIEEFKNRIFYAYERINKIKNMSVLFPKGSIYLFVNIKKTGLSSMEIANKIFHEAHVRVLPGDSFGKSGEGFLRIAVTVGLNKLKQAFDRIEKMDIFS